MYMSYMPARKCERKKSEHFLESVATAYVQHMFWMDIAKKTPLELKIICQI